MTEIIFECYGAPSLAYGIDSLFSYSYNKGRTGLVVSSGYTSTHVIPVYNSKAMLGQATRLNWGGYHAADYLLKLIRLKYPSLNAKTNLSQAEHMLREFCYISPDYNGEVKTYLDWTGLEDRDIVMQYPFTEEIVVQKSQEDLDKAAEKKRLNGLRLQEQAAKMRLEKLMQKEKQLERYKKIQEKLVDLNKKDTRRLLDDNDLRDEAALEKTVKELDKAIRRSRMKDVGGGDEDEQGEPVFDLLDVPDDQLDEAGLRNKRQQRLSKASYDARQRAKAEKESEKARIVEEKRQDEERRENDLQGWLEGRHQALADTMAKMKEKERLKQDLGNRKSLASQIRMKSIANLASDNPTKKRRRGGDDDDFGANDDDWGVYRDIAVDNEGEEEEEEDLMGKLALLEQDLLRYDDDFTYEDTLAARSDWSRSLLHAFERGPRPFNPASAAENNQIHLNVERIRVPEVVFQPSIAGVDQAGVVEIAGDILTQRLLGSMGAPARDEFLKDIFLTGGNTMFRNFDERLRDGLMPLLPAGSPLGIRRAGDAVLDAWRGAAAWAGRPGWKSAAVTRAEYEEKGADYFKVSFRFIFVDVQAS
jgi:actin-related protein 5